MFIVEVIPLGKTATHSLSYFSHTAHPRGTLVQAPVRGKTVPAMVVSATDAFSMKAALRAATFSLRKLPEQEGREGISRELFEAAEKGARQHGTSVNAVLFAILPREIREGSIPLPTQKENGEHIPSFDNKPRIFLSPLIDRTHEYERMVRESFATKHSIMFVVPTIEHALQFEKLLTTGIEHYTVFLHGGITPTSLKKQYQKLEEEEHPLLIIATPQYSLTERHDIGTILLEHERSGGYVGKTRPYLDFRFMLMTYAALRGITLVLADTIIRSEEIELLQREEALPFHETPKRLELPGTLITIPLDSEEKPEKTAFSLLSQKLEKAIDQALKQKKRIFLFSARRGLSPIVACIDCGHILRDPTSGAPLALMRTMKGGVEERWLISSVSGYRARATDLCPHCGSWRLRERGIGIQHVYDELAKRYDKESIILFDHQTASTQKKATALKEKFYAQGGGTILLGTALAFPYLEKPIDMSAIISMDSLRAIPSWRQQEEMFAILISLREKTHGAVYIQTRTEDDVLDLAKNGTVEAFYAQELQARNDFSYPPYSVFIHFAWKEPAGKPSDTKKKLEELFAPYDISLYSALHGEEGLLQYGLLRIPRSEWPHEQILALLASLPPSIRIMCNPDRIV